jgi:hypothetical protein
MLLLKAIPIWIAFFVTLNCIAETKIEEVLDSASSSKTTIPSWISNSEFYKINSSNFSISTDTEKTNFETSLENYQEKIASIKKLEIPFRLFLSNSKNDYGIIDGKIRRFYYPKENFQLSQKFREAIEIEKPTNLNTYKWITFRFYEAIPDRVWIKSPNFYGSRPVSWYLRSDPLFYSAIFANDLLGSSEKLSDFETAVEETNIKITAPISTLSINAPMIDSIKPESMIPSYTLEQRSVTFLQLTNKDSYSKISKIHIAIDNITQIPIYKSVFNRKGDMISLLVQAISSDASSTIPNWATKQIFTPETKSKNRFIPQATIIYKSPQEVEKLTWGDESIDPNS